MQLNDCKVSADVVVCLAPSWGRVWEVQGRGSLHGPCKGEAREADGLWATGWLGPVIQKDPGDPGFSPDSAELSSR